ncbi:TetR/AcrR family transcriptional regulator [Glutamicibacter protophormiae]|uniref:TetR/AcrR family transcriptional regulator n=1 Tax=Glutamicibacter protophormiae TaxID=37930 RepID=UPI002A811A0D|nr:TetR/AcrR family transcriptional regulator [Glutamicibacter protophormiae]WPR66255.1 TetR/AcrR family transcriptional regulator [Glutamicibacter protophormiae]WPR69752.1 TetR/AcrR family transcriptional regulator [Glutamicibacter protophormiae]
MARTLAFDRAEVVRRARAVFWSRGYESAAIPELEAATGLSRSSIYNSFGSKRGLFDAAVDSYLDEVVRPRLADLAGGDVAAQALDEYLAATQAIFQKPESLPAANGCLLINSANAPIASDEHVSQAICAYRGELHAAFSRGLQAAVPGLADQRLALLADAVTGLVVAAFALVRISPAEAARLVESARRLARAQA